MNVTKKNAGFTLVELLVVIAIIGILIGLLLPAIAGAIESARRAQCANNIRSLAQGTVNYETTKGQYPPYVKKYGVFGGGVADPSDPGNYAGNVPRHVKVGGYGVAILPFIDQQAIYETWSEDRYPIITNGAGDLSDAGNGYHANAAANVATFRCPSDTAETPNISGLNSYSSNNGMSFLRPGVGQIFAFNLAESKNNGVFNAKYVGVGGAADITVGGKVTAEDMKDGLTSTLIYAENAQAMEWFRAGFLTANDPSTDNCLTASATDIDLAWSQSLMASKFTNGLVWHYEDRDYTSMPTLGFGGNTYSAIAVSDDHRINGGGKSGPTGIQTRQMTQNNAARLARPSAFHYDGINAGMADGSNRFITDSIDYRVYQAIMTPRGKSSNVPFREFVLTDQVGQ